MFKFTGTVKVIQETQRISEKFQKREFVVTDTTSMYPQDIIFQTTQDKCSLLDQFQANDNVEVSFNLRGREWINQQGEAKYFNSIQGWRIERVQDAGSAPSSAPNATAPETPVFPTAPSFTEEDHDDLPF